MSGSYSLAKNSLGVEGAFLTILVRGGGDTPGGEEGGDVLDVEDGWDG